MRTCVHRSERERREQEPLVARTLQSLVDRALDAGSMCATDRRRCFSLCESCFQGKTGKACDPRGSRNREPHHRRHPPSSCKSLARLVKACLRRVFRSDKSPHQRQELSLRLLLLAISIGCFLNSMTGDFVHDDLSAICSNPDVVGRRSSLSQIFSNDFWGKAMSDPDSHKSYRPLTILSFR